MDDAETLNRRARLRELISFCFNNKDEDLRQFIKERTDKLPNQGELSAIQKDHGKSFGDKKAKVLTEQIGLHRRWFDFTLGTNLDQGSWLLDPNLPTSRHRTRPRIRPKSGEVAFYVLDAHAACGDGALNADYPEIVRALVMTEAEARKLVGSLNKTGSIQVILASGDSMTPTIQPRDLLFVDTHLRDYRGEGVYLLLHGQELLCKRLSMVGRILTVSSDNKRTPSWAWKDRLEDDRIIGRVVCVLPMNFTRL